jgi:hypothetical protein
LETGVKIEIKCVITGDDGKVLQEYTVVEFETEKVIASAGGTDADQN